MRRAAVALAALGLLSACEMHVAIVVKKDGSGTFGFSFGIDKALLALVPSGDDPLASMEQELKRHKAVPVNVERYATDTLKGVRATIAFSSPGDFNSKIRGLGGQELAGGVATLERAGDGYRVVFRASYPMFGDQGLVQLGKDVPPQVTEQFLGQLDAEFRVTLPGKPATHNANRVTSSGGSATFVWDIDVRKVALDIRAETKSSSIPIVPVASGGVAALAVLAAVFLRARRARSPSAPPKSPSP